MKINTDIIDSMKVSIYQCASSKEVFAQTTILDFLTGICSRPELKECISQLRQYEKHSDERKIMKRNTIPCATLSCVCDEYRSRENIIVRNPIAVIDIDVNIDKDENTSLANPEKLNEVKRKLLSVSYVYAVGTSCSGCGLFALVLLDENVDDVSYLAHFKALQEDFAQVGIKIDERCKDVTRLRFASLSSEIEIKRNTYLTPYSRKVEEKKPIPRPFRHRDILATNERERFILTLVDELLANGFVADDYNTWIVCGFKLASFGALGKSLFEKISESSPKYDGSKSVDLKWQNLSQHSKSSQEDCVKYFCSKARRLLGNGYYNRIIFKMTKPEKS